jgi:hypothetical protein
VYRKIALLLAVALLVASFAAGLKARSGWKWNHRAVDNGFTWDPGPAGLPGNPGGQ